jgi:hypothetical protein
MNKENLSSRAWKELQRGTASKESSDGFAALVGVWWSLRRAKKSEREMIEAVERAIKTLAAKGQSRRAIARQLDLCEGTVRYHLKRMASGATDGRPRRWRRELSVVASCSSGSFSCVRSMPQGRGLSQRECRGANDVAPRAAPITS